MSGSLSLQDNPTLEQIEAVQAEALRLESEIGVQIPTWHHYADGLVARTIFVPAGVVAFGAAHRFGQINIAHGDITVYCEGRVTRYTGFNVIPSGSGAKRQGLAHQDTWWTTIHANPDNCRDERELERRFYEQPELMQTARMDMPALEMEAFQ